LGLDDPRVQAAIAIDAYGDPRRAADPRQTYSRLVAALDALSPTLRSTVVLVALQGLSHDEAGVILGCPPGTVAWRMHQARGRLRVAKAKDESEASDRVLALVPATRDRRVTRPATPARTRRAADRGRRSAPARSGPARGSSG
jgi:hypothetical protein